MLPLELICKPIGVFDSYRLMSQGTVISSYDSLARLSTTLDAMLPLEAKVLNSQHEIPLKAGIHMKTQANADGRFRKHDEQGVLDAGTGVPGEGMFNGVLQKLPIMTDVETERFIVIPPGQRRTVCVRPICALVQSGLYTRYHTHLSALNGPSSPWRRTSVLAIP